MHTWTNSFTFRNASDNMCLNYDFLFTSVLLENATHLVQPLDVRIFSPMKAEMMNRVASWRQHNPGVTLNKYELVRVVLPALRTALGNKDTIKEGFRASGLFVEGKGWDPSQVDFSRMKASEVFAQKKDNEDPNSVNDEVPEVSANVPGAPIILDAAVAGPIMDMASLSEASPSPSCRSLSSITKEVSSASTKASVTTMAHTAVTDQLSNDLRFLMANDSTVPVTRDLSVPFINVSVTSDQASPGIRNPSAPVTSDPEVPLTIDVVVPVTSDPVIPVASVQVQDYTEPVESENPTLKFSKKLSLEDRKRRYVFCDHI